MALRISSETLDRFEIELNGERFLLFRATNWNLCTEAGLPVPRWYPRSCREAQRETLYLGPGFVNWRSALSAACEIAERAQRHAAAGRG